MALRHSG